MNIMREIVLTNRLPISYILATAIPIVNTIFFGIQTQIDEHVTNLLKFMSHPLIMSLNCYLEGLHPMIIINRVVAFVIAFCHNKMLTSFDTN